MKKNLKILILILIVFSISPCFKKEEKEIVVEEPKNTEINLEEKTLIENYLQENISDLSPEKEVLGGKFYITKLEIKKDNSGLVEYEDGHIALQANFDYQINDQDVNISKFTITEDEKIITDEHFKCEKHEDCIPQPACHPQNCINKKFTDQYKQPDACTMLFDFCAAYEAEDCLCQQGTCFNQNLMNPDCEL